MKKKIVYFSFGENSPEKKFTNKKMCKKIFWRIFFGCKFVLGNFFQVFSNSKKNYNGIQNKIIYNSVNGDNITSVFHDGKQSWGVCDITV